MRPGTFSLLCNEAPWTENVRPPSAIWTTETVRGLLCISCFFVGWWGIKHQYLTTVFCNPYSAYLSILILFLQPAQSPADFSESLCTSLWDHQDGLHGWSVDPVVCCHRAFDDAHVMHPPSSGTQFSSLQCFAVLEKNWLKLLAVSVVTK